MGKVIKETIHAKGIDIDIYTSDFQNEYISLTDIARYKSDEPKDVIKNWLRSKDTIQFLGLWEVLHNRILKGSNSTPLKMQQARMHLLYPRKNGLKKRMQLV